MNDQHHHHQAHFDSAFSIYYARLNEAYQAGIKNAVDKQYAQGYFRTILFEQNEAIPSKTVFFSELRSLFDHFEKLRGKAAILYVMEHLDAIREKSREALRIIEGYCEGDNPFIQLSDHYEEQLDYGATESEIIEQEQMALNLSDRHVIELLALYSATQKLLESHLPGTTPNLSEEADDGRKDRLTIPQKVLVMYYLLEAVGIKEGTAPISKIAQLLHLLFGVPAPNEMSNSDIYKLFRRPHREFDLKTKKDLNKILTYFISLGNESINKKIVGHLRDCKGSEESS